MTAMALLIRMNRVVSPEHACLLLRCTSHSYQKGDTELCDREPPCLTVPQCHAYDGMILCGQLTCLQEQSPSGTELVTTKDDRQFL